MVKKSITVDIDSELLQFLHLKAVYCDTSRKNFIEQLIKQAGENEEILKKVKEIVQKSPAK